MQRLSRDAVCQLCRRPLSNTWRRGEQLCCECGLSDDLFRPEKRWMHAGGDTPPTARVGQPASKNGGTPARSGRLAILRLALKVLAAIAPAAGEELGARMFFTPRRAPRWTRPVISNLAGLEFRFSLGRDEIACWSWGRGPTVMLIHGWEGYAAQLIHFVRPLLDAGFRVVTFDMPAHGGSSGRRVSAFDMSRAIRAVSQLFSPIRAVIAHSLGGTASIFALSEGLEVERAVLLAPGAEPRRFALALATQLGFSNVRAEGMVKRIEKRLGMPLEDASTLRVVPTMKVPVLVMHDPLDAEVPFEHGRSIAEAWPGARLELLRQMGHRRMLRDADVINSATAFITSVNDDSARHRSSAARQPASR